MKLNWTLRWLAPALLALPMLLMARTALAALGVSGVQPSSVPAGTSSQIAITGTDFVTGTVALLDGYGVLDTTYVAPTLLTAALPGNVPAGVYTVRVIAPDGTQASLASALTVVGPTATPSPTTTPQINFTRPQLIVVSYGASSPQIAPGENYDFEMTVQNAGSETATNIVAEFAEGDFLPRVTGGIRAVGSLTPGQTARFFQPLYAVRELSQKKVASLDVKITYTTAKGESYTDTFTLTFPVVQPGVGGTAQPTATPTVRPVIRPQMIVRAYRTDVEQLVPGKQFVLQMDVENVGNASARRLTLIVGGGTAPDLSTPTGPGGITGGSGSFTDFAPVQSSNVQSLGDLEAQGKVTASQPLIVNSATKAGAYPLKLSLVYIDERGQTYVDDQVITLLVFQTPQIEINFYRDPGPLFASQPNQLPIQIVNLGRQTALFGNMKVTAEGAGEFSNNVLLIGSLDPGNTFPLDATFIPNAAGPTELVVTVDYTDDFNQPQKITAKLTVDVLEGFPTPDPGQIPDNGGGNPGGELAPETTGELFVRFLRGLFGLGSARPQPTLGVFPIENFDNGGVIKGP